MKAVKEKQASLQIPVRLYKKLHKYAAEKWGMSARALGKILLEGAIDEDFYTQMILKKH